MVYQVLTQAGRHRVTLLIGWNALPLRHATNPEQMACVQLKELTHDNIAMFVGACTEPEHISYAIQYYSRGTVQVSLDSLYIHDVSYIFLSSWLSVCQKLSNLVEI